jgi:phage tail sheath gpL-like
MTISYSEATGGPVPKVEIEIQLRGTGALPTASDYRDIWILAERVAAGTSTANEVRSTPFGSVTEAIAWFGATSAGANMAAQVFNFREPTTGKSKGQVYGAAVAESGGVAATQTLVWAINASADGVWIVEIGGHPVSVSVSSGDTPTQQGDAFVLAYNALSEHQKPPVTVANVAGTVTLTATGKGASWNTIGIEVTQDPDITTTLTPGGALMAGGTLYPSLTTVLAAMAPVRTPVIVTPWNEYAAAAAGVNGAVKDHVIAKSAAPNQLGSTAVSASIDTTANLATDADNLDVTDGERYNIVGVNDCTTWVGEIAAKFAALNSSEPHLARSVDGLQMVGVDTPSVSNNFTEAQLVTLLNGGITPLQVPSGGDTLQVVRAVSIRQDFGVLDWATMTVLDFIRDDLQTTLQTAYSRASIIEDTEELPAGAGHVTQPKTVRSSIKRRLKVREDDGYLTRVDELWDDVETDLDTDTGQLDLAIPLDMVKQWHNTRIALRQEVP